MDKVNYGLYLVTDTNICPREKLLSVTESAIKGGVTLVQLREKDISTREFFDEASELKKLCKHYDVPLLINDRIDIALAVDADGIHIGQSDMPLKVSRRILGSNKIIGLSAGNVNQAVEALNDGADYLGVGAVFPTSTKKDASNVGIDMLKQVRKSVDIPIVGIGGINPENISQLYGSGIEGVAVVSCIMGSENPYAVSKQLSQMVKEL